jgi:GcrA cell cycle regulator
MVDWTEDMIMDMKTSLEEGKSSAVISRELNEKYHLTLTRNSVIGKIHRLNLISSRKVIVTAAPKEKSNVVRMLKQPKKTVIPMNGNASYETFEEPQEQVTKIPVTILQLEANDCRWPVNSPRQAINTLFCAHPKAVGSFCGKHAKLAYNEPRYWEKRKYWATNKKGSTR